MLNMNQTSKMSSSSFTIKDFINETKDDFNSPTTSTFSSNISNCKQIVNSIEENLDLDRNGLSKMKKSIKAIHNGGCANSENKIYLSEALEKLGLNSTNRDKEEFIGAAFVKFSFMIKELSSLEKTLMQNLNNIIMFPLDNVLKGDLKGVKNDLKKPVEKSWKEYDIKISKIEKEKKAQAKEAGLIRTEISGAEIAEEMDRERKQFQYQMCEYFIKVNEIETKKSVDLLLHYIEYFNALCEYFRGGLDAIDQFQTYINELSVQLQQSRQRKEDEKRELIDLKNLLKTSNTISDLNPSSNPSVLNELNDQQTNRRSIGYSLHQLQGNKQYGCYKSGYLLKKSESKMRVKVWQKRKCEVKDGFLYIWHSDESKMPTKVNLLTCQIKTNSQSNSDEKSLSNVAHNNSSTNLKNCGSYFHLVSCNRTYHLQVEDENDAEAWISVLINSKEGALKKEFDNCSINTNQDGSLIKSQENCSLTTNDQSLRELQQSIIEQIRKLPGNDCCVDCGSTKDPTWLSTNFGVLTCIECSGIHREMGVHVSRIQSLTLDNIGTSQLLIARVMSNNGFNDIMEASCNLLQKPNANSTMDERNQFIRSKYLLKKFIIRTCTSDSELLNELEQAVQSKDIFFLLQVWAEGANLSCPLPSNVISETSLHYAIMHEFDGFSLHMVDFLIQNSANLNSATSPDCNTPLHYAVIYNRSECMKLLLRSNADFTIKNASGQTPLDIAKAEHNVFLVELLECAAKKQKSLFENVIIDWSFQPEDPSTDFSDDDIDDKNWVLTPEELSGIRRGNFQPNQGTICSNQINRFRNSNRKYSFKYPIDIESEINNQSCSNIHTSSPNQKTTSRPSSVIGDIHVVNFDANCQNLSSFKPTHNNSHESDQQTTFVRGNLNPIRTSGRNRLRLSAGPETPFLLETSNNSIDNGTSHSNNKSFVAGHSRAASADINHVKQGLPVSTANPAKPPLKNGQHHHARNNSVDNSLVTSPYQPFPISSNSPNMINVTSSKPAIPVKPSGIVSVFVPGSTATCVQQTNKNSGVIYTKPISNSGSNVSKAVNSVNNTDKSTIFNSNKPQKHPVPPPRKKPSSPMSLRYRRCVALYDCEADQNDELSFKAGEIIAVINEETNDDEWMEGVIENEPSRRGLFPAIFVDFLI